MYVHTVSNNSFLHHPNYLRPFFEGVPLTELVLELFLLDLRCLYVRPVQLTKNLDGINIDMPLIRPVLDELLLPLTVGLSLAEGVDDSKELSQKCF